MRMITLLIGGLSVAYFDVTITFFKACLFLGLYTQVFERDLKIVPLAVTYCVLHYLADYVTEIITNNVS